MKTEEIGAAKVGQTFNAGGRKWMRNEEIPIDTLRSWRNVPVMIEKGYIHAYPASVTVLHRSGPPEPAPNPVVSVPVDEGDIRRIIISKGFGAYDVIEGRVLAKQVEKAEAHRIAGIPFEAEKPRKLVRTPEARSRATANKPPPAMPEGVGPKEDNGPID
jgi:hypothetical protein